MADIAPLATTPGASTARGKGQVTPTIALVAALALVPVVAAAFDDPFLVRIAARIIIFAIAAVSLNLILGFGGLVSLMHAGLFGGGGYVVAILAHHDYDASPLVPGLTALAGTANLGFSIPIAIAIAGLVSLITGVVALRTRGSYFIMITLAFNEMLYYFFVASQKYGGQDGLQILASLHVFGFEVGRRVPFYYSALAVLALVLFGLGRLVDSRFGMVLRACAQNDRRVIALGVPSLRYKLTAFVLSGMIAGLAGALWATSQQFISPADMSWVRSGDLVVMTVLGGIGAVWGPVIGTIAFLVLELMLASLTTYWALPFGLLVIGMVVFLNGGLVGLWARVAVARGARRHG
ncbi:MAG: branched-chain amino acid ABC transporter permease [Bradyrhizobium sp.]